VLSDTIVLRNIEGKENRKVNAVTVSPKFQVVIPRAVREKIGLKPGQKLLVFEYDNNIILIPMRPIQQARGSIRGIDTDVQREEYDEERG
jgi:AbrB family looped-hinge helix DNA binding protein